MGSHVNNKRIMHQLIILTFAVGYGATENSDLPSLQLSEDLFSSTSKLEGLVAKEQAVVQMLEMYAAETKAHLQTIERYIKEYKLVISGVSSAHNLVANPIDAYMLVKRTTVEWDGVERAIYLMANRSRGVFDQVLDFRHDQFFPNQEDLNGAAIALVRLHDTYRLNMTDLANGILKGTPSSKTDYFHSQQDLGARDCLFLGKHAFNRGYFDTAVQWAEAAISKVESGDETLGKREILSFLDMAVRVHDETLERRGPLGAYWQTNPVPIDKHLRNIHKEKYSTLAKSKFIPKLWREQTDDEETEHYERLCRGEKMLPAVVEAKLFCYHVTRNHPYLLLQPLKVEETSRNPSIVIIHDLLNDGQLTKFKELAEPKLHSSRHKSSNGQGFVKSMIRTSKNAWLEESDDPMLSKISKRITTATGLLVQEKTSAEDYQVANYGIGGLYVTHTDHLMHNPDPNSYGPWERLIGDRLATLMVYLTDVEAGGATVFPRAGVTLWPEKGAAAFWYNLYRSGEGDDNTRHGACPVLHGSKWVSNKWIRYNDQFLTAQCGLHKLDKYRLMDG
ncbi:prolyl 4-hydroxylase subunit alpha-2-like [Artemia franciscana]